MKYRVGLTQRVIEEATVEVEANSAQEAEDKALAKALSGDIEWRFLEANETPEISAEPEEIKP